MARIAHDFIVGWLREDHPAALEQLFARADETRRANVGDDVHLRGLIEISSYCVGSATTADCARPAPCRAIA